MNSEVPNTLGAEIDQRRSSPSRLAAVHETGLLDRPEVETLARLSRLAAQLLDVPVSFMSLVDSERDFYASQCGFGSPLAESRELTGITFCHLAAMTV